MPTLMEDLGLHFTALASNHEILNNMTATQIVANTNLFYVIEPATPNECITIIPYGGAPPETGHKWAQSPSVQIRVKASGVARGYKITQAIINELDMNVSVGSNIPMKTYALQSAPMFLKWDEEDYPCFVCNFDIKHVKYTVS